MFTGISVQVTGSLPGGFSVTIKNPHAGVMVPNVFGEGVALAKAEILAAGLVPVFTGPNQKLSWVRLQSPAAGAVVPKGSTVTMTLSNLPPP